MKLHRILLRHCAPRDCVEVTERFVIADDEEEILRRLADKEGKFTYGLWWDRDEDASDDDEEVGVYYIYDERYNVIGTETYMERMLRLRGEFHDEDADYSDAYYGHWGWNEGVEITPEDAATLLRLGIAEDWRTNDKEQP